MPTLPFRVIDTGVRDGRQQIAFDQALIELHSLGRVPDTVRFLRFAPSALVGRHQAISHELKLAYCRDNGIGVVRRITGGGAIYLDPGQVGWEVVLSRKRMPMPTLADYTRALCEAVAHGLSRAFSIDARFRPRNDIEVGGQKLCGTGGFFDGDTLFFQGTVLVDADPVRVISCLNVPDAKLKKRDLDKAESRLTTLTALLNGAPDVASVHDAVLAGLSERLGLELEHQAATKEEETLARKLHDEEIGTDDFVFSIDDPRQPGVCEASRTGPGGTVSAYLKLEGPAEARRIRHAILTGDFFVTPPRIVYDLEAQLRGEPVEDAGAAVRLYFAAAKPDLLSITPDDFVAVVEAAIASGERA
jgi:lipoate-protein ligase A